MKRSIQTTIKTIIKNYIPTFSSSYKDDEIGLFVPQKQLNWVVSGLLLFGVVSFMTGYFWGQRKAVEYFIKRIEEDSFADRISYALYTMNDRDSLEFEDAENEQNDVSQTGDQDDELSAENTETSDDSGDAISQSADSTDDTQEIEIEEIPVLTQEALESSHTKVVVESPIIINQPIEKTVYLAPLAGFGTLQSARVFLGKIKNFDNKASIVERASKSPKGRKIKWYQVVTSEFENKQDLNRVVERIQHKEHIGDVHIVDRRKAI